MHLTGGCLCGGVRYRIDGQCRDVVNCHCENCRRTHGHHAAYTALHKSALSFESSDGLQWYHDASPDTWRGFCNRCGASLFWSRHGAETISIMAGALDGDVDLPFTKHIFVKDKAAWMDIPEGAECFDEYSG